MPRKPLNIGTHQFPSKSAALAYVRRVRDRYEDDQPIPAPDDGFLRSLLARHPNSAAKVGCGVDHFIVRPDAVSGIYRHFLVCRTDGSSEDFSFMRCL